MLLCGRGMTAIHVGVPWDLQLTSYTNKIMQYCKNSTRRTGLALLHEAPASPCPQHCVACTFSYFMDFWDGILIPSVAWKLFQDMVHEWILLRDSVLRYNHATHDRRGKTQVAVPLHSCLTWFNRCIFREGWRWCRLLALLVFTVLISTLCDWTDDVTRVAKDGQATPSHKQMPPFF